jgi:hypothetical protein
LTAIIDAVASLAIQKVKVLPSPVLQYEPIRRGTHTPHTHARPPHTNDTNSRACVWRAVLQFDNPFEEGGVTKVEVVAPTAKTNVQTPRSHINEDEDEEEEEEEGPGSADQQSEDEDNTATQKDKKVNPIFTTIIIYLCSFDFQLIYFIFIFCDNYRR